MQAFGEGLQVMLIDYLILGALHDRNRSGTSGC